MKVEKISINANTAKTEAVLGERRKLTTLNGTENIASAMRTTVD